LDIDWNPFNDNLIASVSEIALERSGESPKED